jgi:DNA polymerase III alpha subunit
VIAPDEITNYAPLYMSRKNEIATQYDMYDVENIGLLKMDFLGLRTLTVVNDTSKLINGTFELNKIPMNDSKTFQLFRDGNTTGIFQFESQGMQKWKRGFAVRYFMRCHIDSGMVSGRSPWGESIEIKKMHKSGKRGGKKNGL